MSKPTLVILAAGMASRYGSMKQTEGFGPGGESIMDYSIFDAIAAGFGKIVFIIRKDFADQFEPVFNKKLNGRIPVSYVYQHLDSFTEGFQVPADRVKPWGTGHALLCAGKEIDGPFAIINADDFYGRDAFAKAAAFLTGSCTPEHYAIIGYALENTLSENGTVSRGVCTLDEQGCLLAVTERIKVFRNGDKLVYEEDDAVYPLPNDTRASMNFWCFDKSVMAIAEKLFTEFLNEAALVPKSEFFLTNIGDYVIKNKLADIAVIPTESHWFGVTYKQDAVIVTQKINALVASDTYPPVLWKG